MNRWLLGVGLSAMTLVGAFSLACTQSDPPIRNPAPGQLRGLWVDAFGPGLKTPQEIDQLVTDAKAMKLNALFAQIGRRGDCYCNNASMPRTTDPAVPAGFDSLAYLIDKAHASGIQVHAWIITTAIQSVVTPPPAPEHVINAHGPTATGRDNWLMTRVDGLNKGGNDYLLDPGHPDAANYIANMYSSVVKNYAVDGVQFDRVRYTDFNEPSLQPTWGYNPTALERFKLEANRPEIVIDDKATWPKPTDEAWMQWRRDQITNLVRRVYLEVKRIRPEVWVSAATITYGAGPKNLEEWLKTRTYTEVLQDWVTWMREGILDLNIPMNYKRDHVPDQAKWFDQWNQFAVAERGSRLVASGSAIYLNYQDGSVKQVQNAFRDGADGWVGYSYRTPDADVNAGTATKETVLPQLTAKLTANAFLDVATWGAAPGDHLTALFGRLTQNGQPVSSTELEVIINDGAIRRLKTDGNGYFGAPILPFGEATVKVMGAPEGAGVKTILEPGKVAFVEIQTP